MSQRVNPDLKQELLKYGVKDWNECFHCGNCTATCPLTDDTSLFPRRTIRQAQMGISDSLEANVDPWMCYYCGDCSKTCPRDANPGELMMSLRRYLTSKYDWTGLARQFYTKHWFEFVAILVLAVAVGLLFSVFNPNGLVYELNGQGGVQINKMFPIKYVHLGDLIMAAGIGLLLITNIFNMWYKTILKPKVKVPFVAYITGVFSLGFHFGTQAKFSKCDGKGKRYWGSHWLLMTGYTIMFILVVALLPKFQTEKIFDWYHPQRLLGYYATFGLLFGLIVMFIGRIHKTSEKFKFSHLSDWLFIIMLFLTTVTGILVHIFRINGMVDATYWSYVIHLAILVPMICIEVPFSKWSHLAYRPFAIYFAHLKKAAKAKECKTNAAVAVA
ncbi:MAG: 4Fe-4S dicluster domain-containing protein [Bacteroidetes bacterium]|nr:4Fe-4S dicluster domain-containing protein [Bacteroidota bacterium]